MANRAIILIFLALISFEVSNSIILDCTYQIQTLWNIQNIYVCTARVIVVGDLRNVTDVSQNHMTGRTNDDVKGISIRGQTLRFVPRNIDAFFPNIESLFVQQSQIQELFSKDLKNLPNLREVNMDGNLIEVISADLFEENQNITGISFSLNPMKHIDYKAFEKLPNLTTLFFSNSLCISHQAWNNRAEVLRMIFLLLVNCPPSFEMTERRLVNGVELQKSVDVQVADRINPLTWNVFEMDQKLDNHEERIAKLEDELLELKEILAKSVSKM